MLLVTWFAARRLLKPVDELTRAAGRMAQGDLDCEVPVTSRDELGQLAEAFNTMAGNLARIEALRRNMISDIAHELRTPLTNIRCLLEAIQDGLAEPIPETINSIHEEAMLLSRLVHDLQELALAEAGQLPLDPVPVDVAMEIRSGIRLLATDRGNDAPGVELDLPDLPRGRFDPARLRQVVRNLVENALIHTPSDGMVTVSAETVDNEIRVAVSDTGLGISPGDLPQIFERFYRADRSRARDSGGTGLGLTIVRKLVEAHGGAVYAESEPGRGSVFTFTIPLANQS
jgi:signal transduction histidine kinase